MLLLLVKEHGYWTDMTSQDLGLALACVGFSLFEQQASGQVTTASPASAEAL